ncbi:LysR substrate-binding domain-containing protein [Saccharospirillum mangrovi]|uniref:LysR substrate-binding domain-containing protein n=1 Tax=Saccharospirillum mangrovi TaxID=2161747 RepID=UPI000D3440B7|nr:LysR substrate-binding domain-containing protein [Saccharospirillum mangrovi]
MNWTLRQLRLFEAVARLGKLTLAADEQAISQSAASQALRELETALGYNLLVRQGREKVLSNTGQQILPRVRQILQLTQSLALPDSNAVAGTLRLVASVSIACYLLPPMLADFAKRYPDSHTLMQIDNSRGVLEKVRKGQAQLGLIEGPALDAELLIQPWRDDELALFCAPEHALATHSTVSASVLAQQDWIVREQGSGTRAVLDAALQARGLVARPRLELSRQEAIKQSVRAGLGIGCLSAMAIVDEVAAGQVIRLNTDLDLRRRFAWVCSPEQRQQPLVRAFIEQLQAG